MRINRWLVPKQAGEIGLSCRHGQQIDATYDLVDAGAPIVDDDREVVGRDAVIAQQYDIVDLGRDLPMQHVAYGLSGTIGPQPKRRPPSLPATLPFSLGQIPTGAWISGRRAVWRRSGFGNLTSAAEALVRPVSQADQRFTIGGQPLSLHNWLAIERDAQGREIGQLPLGNSRPNPCRVEIFDAEQETTPCRSRKEPRKQRRTKISEVQITCWAGCIAARADAIRRSERDSGELPGMSIICW